MATTRRRFLRFAALGTGSLALAACGATQSGSGDAAPAGTAAPAETAAAPAAATSGAAAPATVSSTGSTVEITYWGGFSGALGEAEQGVVDSFNSAQSEVKVTLQPHAGYEEVAQKLTAALQAQTTPDIALLSDVWWFKFYTAQALAPLNDMMTAQDVDRNDYVDVLLNEGVRNDTVYWIPFARSTPLFYYNKEAWSEAGLPDRGPQTWDEFQEWAPKLMTEVNGQPRSAFAHPSAASYIAWLFQGVIWQFGGSYSDPDFTVRITEPNAARAAQFYGDTVHNFKWATTPKDINQDFVTGLTASMMASTGGLLSTVKNAPFEVGTAFLPEQDAFGCPTGGAGLAIMAASPTEKQQAAMKYIAFVTGTEGATSWSQSTGYMPVRKSAVESAEMQEFFTQNPNFKTAVDQLPKTRPQDVARVYIPGGDQIIGKGLEQITVAGGEVGPALADVAKTLSEEARPVIEAVRAIEG